jgi:pyruvyltransferase
MSEPVTATWCQSANVGDFLTPWLIKKITGHYPIYAEPVSKGSYLLGAGSILTWAQKGWVVWGAGVANKMDCVNPECDLRLVRGPLSRRRAVDCEVPGAREVSLGDPGLLVSRFHKVERPTDPHPFRVGVLPHYVDMQRAWWWWGGIEHVQIINVFAPLEEVLNEIVACDVVFSSSLHGLVFADAYQVPNVWMRLSDSILGDGAKFEDYLMSVHRSVTCRDWREGRLSFDTGDQSVLEDIVGLYKAHSGVPEAVARRQESIMLSCPFISGVLK